MEQVLSGVVIADAMFGHAAGGPGDLPIPLPLVLAGVGGIVAGAIPLARRRSRPAPTPADVEDRLRPAAQTLGALLMTLVLVIGVAGPAEPERNPSALVLFVVGWALLVPASAVAGRVWHALNPLRTLARLAVRGGVAPAGAPERPVGVWPAVVTLVAFLWVELVIGPDSGPVAAVMVLCMAVVAVTVVRHGEDGVAAADGFEAASDLLARIPRPDLGDAAGLAAVAGVLVGTQVVDLVTELPSWSRALVGSGDWRLVIETVVLVVFAAGGAALTTLATREARLAPALAPMAGAWLLPHALGLVLIDGQSLVRITQRALSPTGSSPSVVDEPVPAALVGGVVLIAFIAGHALAMVRADAIASQDRSRRAADALQLGFRMLVMASALGGITLLSVAPSG